jgi:hypothetical protein
MESPQIIQSEQRISVIVGDRLCTNCSYNLTGQYILREPHYNLLIVRCPECATVASVQEYPLLGRWAVRWAMALAALWFFFLIAFWVGSGAAVFGFSLGTAEWAQSGYQQQVWSAYNTYANSPQNAAAAASGGINTMTNFQTWWNQSNPMPVFGTGQWFDSVAWASLYMWIPLGLCAFTLGCFWAVALLGKSRISLILWGTAVMLVAFAFSALVWAEWFENSPYQQNSWWQASQRAIGAPMLIISLGFGWLMLSIGLVLGRSTVRGLLRVLLPPRLRASLSMLWTVDGLNPPIGLKAHQRRQAPTGAGSA